MLTINFYISTTTLMRRRYTFNRQFDFAKIDFYTSTTIFMRQCFTFNHQIDFAARNIIKLFRKMLFA